MLTPAEARRFYDRFGARQDRQGFYEDAALELQIEHAHYERSRVVVELGCGTGRFAERLFREHLGSRAVYRGFDLSETMVSLARERLARFGARASVVLTDGSARLDLDSGSCDRFVANYVIEILVRTEREALVAEAHRLLEPGGKLCLVTITPGCSLASKMVMGIWNAIHSLRPESVGGCRAISGRELLEESRWELELREVLSRWGIASEVLVARKREQP